MRRVWQSCARSPLRPTPPHTTIAEPVQTDDGAMSVLRRAGALPGREVDSTLDAEGVLVGSLEAGGVISDETAGHIFVSRV